MTPKTFSLFLLGILLVLSSCESEQLTTTQTATERKLEVTPRSLDAEMYKKYTFKARVTNMSLHDPLYYWDFDEGRGTNLNDWSVDTIFYQNKIHTIRIKAVEPYTEEVLGYDSIRVDVRPPAAFVDIVEDAIDTVMFIDTGGHTIGAITLNLKASTPLKLTRTIWDFGDGFVYEDVSGMSSMQYRFPVGTRTVRVSVYEKDGFFVGTDSCQVTIRFPKLFPIDFASARSVSIILGTDTLHPLHKNPLYQSPLAVGFTRSDTAVSMQFLDDTRFLFICNRVRKGNYFADWHDTAYGVLSPSYDEISVTRVSVDDYGFNKSPYTQSGFIRYSFGMSLQLLAVMSTQIVYRMRATSVDSIATNIEFNATGHTNYPTGSFDNNGTIAFSSGFKPGACGLVVFNR